MITEQLTNSIKNTLSGFDEYKMRKQMFGHYKLLHLINDTEEWATPELKRLSVELLPHDITEEKSKDFVELIAQLAERNPCLVNFLQRAENIKFEHLALKVEKEGGQLFPDIVAFAIVLDCLTKATYANPKILENCLSIFKAARQKSQAFKQMSLFHKIKLFSVERAMKIYLNYHKTRAIPQDSGRFGVMVNILEAVINDYIFGFRDNAKAGLILAFHKTGSKYYDPHTGCGPSTWSDDKKAVSMSMPMTKEWCDLYQTWNMAFVSTLQDFPYIIPKLLIPQVASYQDVPTSYMYKRGLALYFVLNHASFNYVEKAKNHEKVMEWNDKKLSSLWGKVNLENAQIYKQLLSSMSE